MRIDQDSSVNLASYKSFSWLAPQPPPAPPTGESKPVPGKESAPPPDPAVQALVETRMRSAVTLALQSKGYAASDAASHFKVSYVLNVYERPKESGLRIGVGAGGGSGNVGGGVGMSIPIGKRTETVAAMTIDIIDSARNAQVWTGSYEQRLRGEVLSDEEARAMVDIILEKYPRAAQ